ncbi:NAD(P)-binding protein [Dichomitus squalens]|uniref:NAD(P)-binding protein n=1 Tax=Dichomitus squalens TaxID=114155 RepID=A0A4Q9P2L7_9APHY|nr:NAD(P)-binding protein [Dichomitus squalens LYAD-421 SS1]EJF64683.1 NAD(P)-binding protein [Dichomitus squalens LYAD-421 SS1]TBU46801.1 NAD(P)-binding protein [Dichomitus squalens]TBU63038.1 NAD(P)-binding protein [Dichomitus squalens]
MPPYLIVGASRGIGLEYVVQLAKRPDAVVIALVRNPAKSTHLTSAIACLKNVHVVAGDVTEYRTLELAAKQVAEITGGGLDYLIHNAANLDPSTFFKGFDDYTDVEQLDADFIDAFKIDSLGPVHSIRAFLPLLRASSTKKIIVLSTGVVRHLGVANIAAYSMTKASGLLATTKYAVQLKDEGFVVISLNPGLVDTSATAINDSASLTFEPTAISFRVS